MRHLLLCVGKLSEPWQRASAGEYMKRLTRYGDFGVVEVADEREPASLTPAAIEGLLGREGERLLRHVRDDDTLIALCLEGETLTSEQLARELRAMIMAGRRVVWVIGGSLGLSDKVTSRAGRRISLSKMTFPHALARILLLEQLYRASKINAGERYHK